MGTKISVVINTLKEEQNIERAIKSVKWADEVVVCDMYSEDRTVELAKELGAKVVYHKKTNYVEPARNFAVSKALGDWILILDADEEIPDILASKLQQVVSEKNVDFVKIPRKNIIFGKWMRASMWWPDYNIRFFKKGSVVWGDEIHRPPQTSGYGIKLPTEEQYAIVHYHYKDISQFIERMNRYSKIQAEELKKRGVQFQWSDLIAKPLAEFLGRFFANRGFEDGIHGLALSLLQAFSFLIMYIRLWEMEGFGESSIDLKEIEHLNKQVDKEIKYWLQLSTLPKNPLKRILQKTKNRFGMK